MKKMLIIGILLVLAGSSFFSGCIETGAEGSLRLQITDKPGDLDILYANVTISMVEVHKSGAGDSDEDEDDEEYENVDDYDDNFIAYGDGPYFGEIDEDIDFNGTASGGTKPYNFSWDFGDGNSTYGQNVTHNYSVNGSYEVNLTVVDNESDSRVDWYITTATIGDVDEDDDNSTAGWYTIISVNQTFDLIALQNVTQLLGQKNLPAGKYTQIRLNITKANITINNSVKIVVLQIK